MKLIKLPIIVCGEVISPDNLKDEDIDIFEYETGVKIALPKFKEEYYKRIEQSSNRDIHDLSIDEIALFIEKVSLRWQNPSYELKEKLVNYVEAITGYCKNIIQSDVDTIIHSMNRPSIYEIIEADLGNAYYLDELIQYKSVYRHAQPRGKVLHIMVGNVPMAGLFTLIRSIVTKNLTIAKLPKRDVVSVLMFALSFIEENKDHPISKSISVGYWGIDSELGKKLIDISDAICCWGKLDTMNNVRKMVGYGKELVEFGPKRSLSVIGDNADLEIAAMRLAYDISIYDQEACFCPLQVFYQGNHLDKLLKALSYYLERALKMLPKIYTPKDIGAHVNRIKLECAYNQEKVISGSNNQWNIIVKNEISIHDEHPLSRTLYLYTIKDLKEVEAVINKDVQTIAIFPFEMYEKIADSYTFLGASRIVELGLVSKPRIGFTHDGMKPLSRLVNWVSIEKGAFFRYKYGRYTLDEANKFLYGGKDHILEE